MIKLVFYGGGLLFSLVATALSYVVWARRKAQARGRLQELDEGKRCIACDGTNLERDNGRARCMRCGHIVSLANLQAAVVRDQDIANVTKPNNRTT